jgi:hypothetical protein
MHLTQLQLDRLCACWRQQLHDTNAQQNLQLLCGLAASGCRLPSASTHTAQPDDSSQPPNQHASAILGMAWLQDVINHVSLFLSFKARVLMTP